MLLKEEMEMKKNYFAPEAELLNFQAAEAVADEITVSSDYEQNFGYQEGDGDPWN